MMKVIETILPGVLILEPKVHGDSRGFFSGNLARRQLQQHRHPNICARQPLALYTRRIARPARTAFAAAREIGTRFTRRSV
jgi:dTDP-4-dehydrorhamnose 3,5-epimerase-like enzyme